MQNVQQTSPKVVPMSVHYSAAVQRALNFTQASIVTQASSTTGKGTTTVLFIYKFKSKNYLFLHNFIQYNFGVKY